MGARTAGAGTALATAWGDTWEVAALQVTVRMHGALRSAAGLEVALSLPEGATAGDLFEQLADRFGAPFTSVAASHDPRLPRQIRLFVGSQMVVSREEPLAAHGVPTPLTVVVMSPIAGG
jgi:hypothetical protein